MKTQILLNSLLFSLFFSSILIACIWTTISLYQIICLIQASKEIFINSIKFIFNLLVFWMSIGLILAFPIIKEEHFRVSSVPLKGIWRHLLGDLVRFIKTWNYLSLLNEHPTMFKATEVYFIIISYTLSFYLLPYLTLSDLNQQLETTIKYMVVYTTILFAFSIILLWLYHNKVLKIEPVERKSLLLEAQEIIIYYISILISAILWIIIANILINSILSQSFLRNLFAGLLIKIPLYSALNKIINICRNFYNVYFRNLNIYGILSVMAFASLTSIVGWVSALWINPFKAYQNYFSREIEKIIRNMKNHYIIVGFGALGKNLAETLVEALPVFTKPFSDKITHTLCETFLVYNVSKSPIFIEGAIMKKLLIVTPSSENLHFTVKHNVVKEIGIYQLSKAIPFFKEITFYVIPAIVNNFSTKETYECANLKQSYCCIISQAALEKDITYLRKIILQGTERELQRSRDTKSPYRAIFRIRSVRDFITSRPVHLGLIDYYNLDEIQGTVEANTILLNSMKEIVESTTKKSIKKVYIIMIGSGKHVFHAIEEIVGRLCLLIDARKLADIFKHIRIIVIQPKESVERISELIELDSIGNENKLLKIMQTLAESGKEEDILTWNKIIEDLRKIAPLWSTDNVKAYLWLPEIFIGNRPQLHIPILLIKSEPHKRGILKNILTNIINNDKQSFIVVSLLQRDPVRADRALLEHIPLITSICKNTYYELIMSVPKNYRILFDEALISNIHTLTEIREKWAEKLHSTSLLDRIVFPYQETKDRIIAATQVSVAVKQGKKAAYYYICSKKLSLGNLIYILEDLLNQKVIRKQQNITQQEKATDNKAEKIEEDRICTRIIEFNAYPCFHRSLFFKVGDKIGKLKKFRVQIILQLEKSNQKALCEILICAPDEGPGTLLRVLKALYTTSQEPSEETIILEREVDPNKIYPLYILKTYPIQQKLTCQPRCLENWTECSLCRNLSTLKILGLEMKKEEKNYRPDIKIIYSHSCLKVVNNQLEPRILLHIYAVKNKITQFNTYNSDKEEIERQYPHIIVIRYLQGCKDLVRKFAQDIIYRKYIKQDQNKKDDIELCEIIINDYVYVLVAIPKTIDSFKKIPFCESHNCRISNALFPLIINNHQVKK